MPQIVDGKAVYSCPPEEFTALVPELLQAGVAIFGGCCGTDAGHIAALKKALDGAVVTPPSPRHPTLLPAATEKLPMYLPADAKHGPVIAVTENLEDDLQEAMDGDEPMVAVALQNTADAEELAQMQYLIEKPLCLVCDDGAVPGPSAYGKESDCFGGYARRGNPILSFLQFINTSQEAALTFAMQCAKMAVV